MIRHERRKVKATAAKTAALFAQVCTDYGPDGKLTPVDQPNAVAALQRPFHRLLQNEGEPQMMRLTLAEAEAFSLSLSLVSKLRHKLILLAISALDAPM